MATDIRGLGVPESLGYVFKRLFLGKPMISEQLKTERLSNPVALGVLSPDAISSSAYGTEEILIELLPYAGLAAFALLLPMTGVILLILVLVTASYRQVVMAYTRAGGSYVVARENFGPRVAQVAAVALLIDYIVTVAVQAAAGTVAVISAIRPLGTYSLEITVAVVIVMCYGNLRGLREAGRSFALPTYFFVVMMTLIILTGMFREIFGDLPRLRPTAHPGHRGDQSGQRPGDRRDDPRAAARIRQRRVVADRPRGDLQRRQRLPQRRKAPTPAGSCPRWHASWVSWWPGCPSWPTRRIRLPTRRDIRR